MYKRVHVKDPLFSSGFNYTYFKDILEKYWYQISWKSVHWSLVVPYGRTNRRTDRYYEANNSFSQFHERA